MQQSVWKQQKQALPLFNPNTLKVISVYRNDTNSDVCERSALWLRFAGRLHASFIPPSCEDALSDISGCIEIGFCSRCFQIRKSRFVSIQAGVVMGTVRSLDALQAESESGKTSCRNRFRLMHRSHFQAVWKYADMIPKNSIFNVTSQKLDTNAAACKHNTHSFFACLSVHLGEYLQLR